MTSSVIRSLDRRFVDMSASSSKTLVITHISPFRRVNETRHMLEV
jgi:hypothetical protein